MIQMLGSVMNSDTEFMRRHVSKAGSCVAAGLFVFDDLIAVWAAALSVLCAIEMPWPLAYWCSCHIAGACGHSSVAFVERASHTVPIVASFIAVGTLCRKASCRTFVLPSVHRTL